MIAVKFVLSKQCKWGKKDDVIEVSAEVANRLKQDGFGDRQTDLDTLARAKAKDPEAFERAASATKEAEAEIADEQAEQEAQFKSDPADEVNPPAGGHSNPENKGARTTAKG